MLWGDGTDRPRLDGCGHAHHLRSAGLSIKSADDMVADPRSASLRSAKSRSAPHHVTA
jgi:hypothetical protein